MTRGAASAARNAESILDAHRHKPLVPIVMCGSGGGGRTSLAARLARGRPAQGALTQFVTDARRFIVLDVPAGAVLNPAMVTDAAAAALAVVVVDVRRGLLADTRRQTCHLSLFGPRRVVLVVNKMDLVRYSADVFARLTDAYADVASRLGLSDLTCIPVSALRGHNVLSRSDRISWYDGPSLLEHLDSLSIPNDPPPGHAAEPIVAGQFEATIVWVDAQPLLQGRSYLLEAGTQTAGATVAPIKYRVDVETLGRLAAKKLDRHDIGVCGIQLDRQITFESRADDPGRVSFVLVDEATRATVGAGLLNFPLRRSQNLRWQPLDIDKTARAALKTQKPCVVWFTGLSGAGKSTIANALETRLHALGRHTYILDGDNVRHGLNKDLGFTDVDRVENIRRIGEVSRLMVDAGLIVLVSFISPFQSERRMARGLVDQGEFIEVFVDTPLAVAEGRDPKGLYRKARRGELPNFTGVDSPYEVPDRPEIRIDTTRLTVDEAADAILRHLQGGGLVNPIP